MFLPGLKMVVHRNIASKHPSPSTALTRQRIDAYHNRQFNRYLTLVLAFVFAGIAAYWSQAVLDESIVKDVIKTPTPLVTELSMTPWAHVMDTNWCQSETKTPGLIYVKVPKTGSSSLSGANIRIARKVGARENLNCSSSFDHGRKVLLNRQEPCLLWSSIRDPAARSLSAFYHFQVSRRHIVPTESRIKEFLIQRRNHQFNYLADHPDPQRLLQHNFTQSHDRNTYWHELIQRFILQPYHFVGLLERKYESFAVLKLLWGLQAEDLVVLDSKKSGGFDDGKFKSTSF